MFLCLACLGIDILRVLVCFLWQNRRLCGLLSSVAIAQSIRTELYSSWIWKRDRNEQFMNMLSFRCCMPLYFAFKMCASTNAISLWISIEKQLHNMHHLTAVFTADLVTCIEHLAFWFYKYHQDARSSVVSYITPT